MAIFNSGGGGGGADNEVKVVTDNGTTTVNGVKVEASQTDLTAGISSLETGKIYLVYE